MVVGTGIDIIEVNRIRRAAGQQTFLNRVFTKEECAYYEARDCCAQTLAGIFAAKEAAAKALATGFNGISWRDIEILHDGLGKPYVRLWNAAKARMESLGGREIHVSISHIKALAIAQAVLED
ncbi:MAG: holo-ACP synthase [Clostridiales bacterium]|jgi:holo-[acyl-carrier-protein] synthase|nr:holo-ACP synthase [Clostridiales bacterium]